MRKKNQKKIFFELFPCQSGSSKRFDVHFSNTFSKFDLNIPILKIKLYNNYPVFLQLFNGKEEDNLPIDFYFFVIKFLNTKGIKQNNA